MVTRRIATLTLSLFAPLLFGYLLFTAANPGGAAHAAPAAIVVDTLDDVADGCVVDGCSLRDAIAESAAGDTITFSVAGTIVLSPTLGDLDIGQDLMIDGGGVITVSGNDALRVFNVTAGNVTFDGLTIANGNVQSNDCGSAAVKCGGGIILQNSGVAVTVTNSTLSGNSAVYGGGIFSWGSLTVTNSTLSGNSAGLSGGGIHNVLTATVSNSTLSGNSANFGGGINLESSATMTVSNSTLSGNSANFGGGIHNLLSTVKIDNSTLTDNRAASGGAGVSSFGDNATLTTIGNSIVSGNVISGSTTADDLALFSGFTNSFSSGGYNLIGTIGANITFAGPGDQTGVNDPGLDTLGDNGGGTLTHALLPGSLAIDSGQCSGGPAADQRGVARPQDDSCDSGAYERNCAMVVVNDQSSGFGSLRETIASVCDGGLITFDNGLANSTIDISPDGELLINKNLTISGTVPITVSGGNAVRVFHVTTFDVTFDSLSIANGNAVDCGVIPAACGGGIFSGSGGTVTVSNSTLSSNRAEGGVGGAIFSSSGTMTVNNSTLSANSAGNGGGISSRDGDSVTVSNSTLSGNSAHVGGGIYSYNSGIVTVINSTLSGNSANLYGGSIYQDGGTVTVSSSTLSDNQAGTSGGGISSKGDGATFTTISSTIVSGNIISGTTTADDLALHDGSSDSFSSGGYNLIGAIGANITSITAAGDMTNTLPLLGPLAGNGGDTMTHALLPGSPAIDAGGSCGVASDQRGITRPQGSACDSGAFESRGFIFALSGGSPQTTVVNTPFADPLALTASSAYGDPIEGGQVTFSAPASGPSVTFTKTVATIGSGGVASLPVTANGIAGSYQVLADASGNSGAALTYDLTNAPAIYLLTVGLDGNGGGTISSSPAGINCGADCSENYATGTVVTLTATADSGSAFTGWSGAGCSGLNDCVLTMTEARSVRAAFTLVPPNEYALAVSLDGDGSGTVTGAGINCFDGPGADCSETYSGGTAVTLSAAAAAGSTFTGWSGGSCSGTGDCVLMMTETRLVTATFTLVPPIEYALTVFLDGDGSGTVTGAGINCFDGPGADCSETYSDGTAVTLSAAAAAGSTFTGWSGGGCSGTGDCVLAMTEAKQVTATFSGEELLIYLPVIVH